MLLGLLAAVTWGAADFAGGLATRRAAPSLVVSIAHSVSLLLLLLLSSQLPVALPRFALVGALISGVAGGLGLMVFYEALSLGAMGLSAALAGLLTAILPVVLAVRSQGAPAPLPIAGFAVAAAAIVLIAYTPSARDAAGRRIPPGRSTADKRALLFAVLAGAGFGFQLVWLHAAAAAGEAAAGPLHAGAGPGPGHAYAPVVRTLLLSRVGGTAVALAAQCVTRLRHRDRLLPAPASGLPATRVPFVLAALAGLLDAGGNGCYMLSSLGGRLDVAAVLSSLYPGATIVLAAIFLRERATRIQALGMGCALAAVALIAA